MDRPPCRAVVFDLFYTLINPLDPSCLENSEYAVLGMSREDFEGRNTRGYRSWGEGKIRDPVEILRKILEGLDYSGETIRAAARARMERIRRGLFGVESKNLELLAELRRRGIKTVLLSNADVMDTRYWEQSPLASCFDGAIFSWQTGILKPEAGMYALVLEKLGNPSPGGCLYVGDGGHGELEGARRAGFTTVLTVEYIRRLWPERIPALRPWADFVVEDITGVQDLADFPGGNPGGKTTGRGILAV
jgi:putative hydrolase of the HAD superfamily